MQKLEKIYKEVPEVNCKGLCVKACGPVIMSDAEERNIISKHQSLPKVDSTLTCSKLIDGRCSIYEDRPLICRLFGAVKKLKCPYKCEPKGGFLKESKSRKLLKRAEEICSLANKQNLNHL